MMGHDKKGTRLLNLRHQELGLKWIELVVEMLKSELPIMHMSVSQKVEM